MVIRYIPKGIVVLMENYIKSCKIGIFGDLPKYNDEKDLKYVSSACHFNYYSRLEWTSLY